MTWLVLWTVITISMVPCPQPGPDEFGITEHTSMTLAICWSKDVLREERVRTFDTEADARTFVERGKKRGGIEQHLTNWRIVRVLE